MFLVSRSFQKIPLPDGNSLSPAQAGERAGATSADSASAFAFEFQEWEEHEQKPLTPTLSRNDEAIAGEGES